MHSPLAPPAHEIVAQKSPRSPTGYVRPLGHVQTPPQMPADPSAVASTFGSCATSSPETPNDDRQALGTPSVASTLPAPPSASPPPPSDARTLIGGVVESAVLCRTALG
eukprot:4681079-Prymnesium_polylepis.1